MHAPHELDVMVVSPEEAEYGTAEFWAGDRLFGVSTPCPWRTSSAPMAAPISPGCRMAICTAQS